MLWLKKPQDLVAGCREVSLESTSKVYLLADLVTVLERAIETASGGKATMLMSSTGVCMLQN